MKRQVADAIIADVGRLRGIDAALLVWGKGWQIRLLHRRRGRQAYVKSYKGWLSLKMAWEVL